MKSTRQTRSISTAQHRATTFIFNLSRGRSRVMTKILLAVLVIFVSGVAQIHGATVTCIVPRSRCFLQRRTCPNECPSPLPTNPRQKSKVCYLNCNSPACQPECRNRKPDCTGPGSACLDPRFIGGDGRVFYFHGKSNQHFALVSDPNIQINARFIGLRPAGRARDFTWIQALGLVFGSHTFSLEAAKATKWDDEIDLLKFSYNGNELVLPESSWESLEKSIKVERTSSDNCFAHLEVQFRFYGISSKVEGVLGRTYQPDFENPAKPGVAMPVVGGEDNYRTTSLLSTDCKSCVFSPAAVLDRVNPLVKDFGTLDCTGRFTSGNGIVCRK